MQMGCDLRAPFPEIRAFRQAQVRQKGLAGPGQLRLQPTLIDMRYPNGFALRQDKAAKSS